MSLVTVSIVGNLVKPPEQMYFASGRLKTTMMVAVNNPGRGGKKAESADFYKVETWGKLAEAAGKYLEKGNQIGVSGRLFLDHWTDKQGNNRVTPVVEATQLAFPPRLKVVASDEEAAEPATGAPIGGEMVFSDQDGQADLESTGDDAYGDYSATPEGKSSKSSRRKVQTA